MATRLETDTGEFGFSTVGSAGGYSVDYAYLGDTDNSMLSADTGSSDDKPIVVVKQKELKQRNRNAFMRMYNTPALKKADAAKAVAAKESENDDSASGVSDGYSMGDTMGYSMGDSMGDTLLMTNGWDMEPNVQKQAHNGNAARQFLDANADGHTVRLGVKAAVNAGGVQGQPMHASISSFNDDSLTSSLPPDSDNSLLLSNAWNLLQPNNKADLPISNIREKRAGVRTAEQRAFLSKLGGSTKKANTSIGSSASSSGASHRGTPPRPARPSVTRARRKRKAKKVLGKYVALDAFDARDATELSFVTGDVIELLAMDDNGWWEGRIGEANGWFPNTFVVPEVEASMLPSPSPTAAGPETTGTGLQALVGAGAGAGTAAEPDQASKDESPDQDQAKDQDQDQDQNQDQDHEQQLMKASGQGSGQGQDQGQKQPGDAGRIGDAEKASAIDPAAAGPAGAAAAERTSTAGGGQPALHVGAALYQQSVIPSQAANPGQAQQLQEFMDAHEARLQGSEASVADGTVATAPASEVTTTAAPSGSRPTFAAVEPSVGRPPQDSDQQAGATQRRNSPSNKRGASPRQSPSTSPAPSPFKASSKSKVLSLRINTAVTVEESAVEFSAAVQEAQDGLAAGRLHGHSGHAPLVAVETSPMATRPTLTSTAAPAASSAVARGGIVTVVTTAPRSEIEARVAAENKARLQAAGMSPPQSIVKVIGSLQAIAEYVGSDFGELSFKRGANLDLIEDDGSGWMKGRVKGHAAVGWFPATFVQYSRKSSTVSVLSSESGPAPPAAAAAAAAAAADRAQSGLVDMTPADVKAYFESTRRAIEEPAQVASPVAHSEGHIRNKSSVPKHREKSQLAKTPWKSDGNLLAERKKLAKMQQSPPRSTLARTAMRRMFSGMKRMFGRLTLRRRNKGSSYKSDGRVAPSPPASAEGSTDSKQAPAQRSGQQSAAAAATAMNWAQEGVAGPSSSTGAGAGLGSSLGSPSKSPPPGNKQYLGQQAMVPGGAYLQGMTKPGKPDGIDEQPASVHLLRHRPMSLPASASSGSRHHTNAPGAGSGSAVGGGVGSGRHRRLLTPLPIRAAPSNPSTAWNDPDMGSPHAATTVATGTSLRKGGNLSSY